MVNKKSSLRTVETALGITSQTPEQTCSKKMLAANRGLVERDWFWLVRFSLHLLSPDHVSVRHLSLLSASLRLV